MPYYFLMITWMKKANNFQIVKVQPQGIAYPLFNFFGQFQPHVAYKSAAYTKKRMQHIQKPEKYRKSWFVNFLSYSHYYLQHFSKRYVCLSLKVLIEIINVNVAMNLKRSFPCS